MGFRNFWDFFIDEVSGGIFLIAAALVAFIFENVFLSSFYNSFLQIDTRLNFGKSSIQKPLILLVNDSLMAVFFFLLGFRLKREIFKAKLRSLAQATLLKIFIIGSILASVFFLYFKSQLYFFVERLRQCQCT
ncbi:Na+/H+ antiporter NhaA [Campylobacter concisus]|jgi:Na(+)/H(+) antiporter nhaA|uniref:Na+/H+ antiporter NhaA n=1 Tax=Campylobacter concisus TaxID=199 RepID=UPI000D3016AA|nr:Na+/H+ antiporter NhaA [Campylobacter concisus]